MVFEHEFNELNESFYIKLATAKLFVLFELFVFKKNIRVSFAFRDSCEKYSCYSGDSCSKKY